MIGAEIAHAKTSTVTGYFHPSGYYGRSSGYYTWVDYCPLCRHHQCLSINPKGTYEGEITCLRCDADFDGTSGADKHGAGARAYLTPGEYEETSPPREVVKSEPEGENKVEPELTGMGRAYHIYSNNKILIFKLT